MLDLPFFTPVEEPLSEAEWQVYLPQHALYAQHRYRYHLRMAISWKEFQPSLAAYQRLTNRNPDPYTAPAISFLQQLMAEDLPLPSGRLWELFSGEKEEPPSLLEQLIAEDLAHPSGRLWELFSGEKDEPPLFLEQLMADDPAHPSVRLWELLTGADDEADSDDLTSLPDICSDITQCIRILQMQEKPFTSHIAHMSEEWRRMAIALAVVIEERALSSESTLPPLPEDAPLAPYPNIAAWRTLVADDPQAARKQCHDLEIQQARVGLHAEFNMLESLAIGRKLRRTLK